MAGAVQGADTALTIKAADGVDFPDNRSTVGRLRERLPDAARHRFVIACVGAARGVQPGGAVDTREVDGVPGVRGELLQVLELRAPVALAERVDMVDVAQYRTGARGEPVRPQPPEILCRHDAAVNVRHAGGDEPPRLEPAPALGDLDGADLTRPGVDVLEQVAMDRFQVGKVEITRRHGLEKALGDERALRRLQRPGVPDVQPVAEER